MQALIEFVLKTTILWAAALFWYRVFLQKQNLLTANRIFLLLSLLLPPLLFSLPSWRIVEEKIYSYNLAGIAVSVGAEAIAKPMQAGWQLWTLLLFSGISIASIRLIINLYKLIKIVKTAKKYFFETITLLRLPRSSDAYTFFGYIIVGEDIAESDLSCVVAHESAHRRLGHSFDVMLVECCGLLFWFHPLVYLYKSLLMEVHEYQADREVRRNYSLQYYGQLLLQHAMNTHVSLIHTFSNHSSQLKKRIFMMSQKNKKKVNNIAYLLSMPLMLAFLWALNVQTIKAQVVSEPDEMPIYGRCAGNNVDEVKNCSMQNLMKDLAVQIKYPKSAKEQKKEGKVFVEFVVSKSGKVEDAKILKSMDPACDAEALRALKSLKQWNPAKKDGKKVAVKMVLPIAFRLS